MDNYRYAKNQFPEFINPGLEFYEGVQLALDSLAKENIPLEVFIYDSKSSTESIASQLSKSEMEDVDLIITHCSTQEVRIFAAKVKKGRECHELQFTTCNLRLTEDVKAVSGISRDYIYF